MSLADPLPPAAHHDATQNLARLRRLTWWSLPPLVGAVCAVGLAAVLLSPRPWAWQVLVVGCYAVAAAATAYLLHRSLDPSGPPVDRPGAARRARLAGWVGLPLGLVLAAGTGGISVEWALLAGGLSGSTAIWLPRGRRSWPVLAATGLVGLVTGLAAMQWLLVAVALTLLSGWGIWQTWWYYDVARQLDLGRGHAAELAVARERLRFAAELHDIQGHHLQVIALKSELAARLAAPDPAAAVAQMREVQQLAREALTETRSLVGGYRSVSLGTEIANATRVLAAAEVDTRPRIAACLDGLTGDVERLLGLVVREATTNILRHAQPRQAQIEVDLLTDARAMSLTVRNDGAGPDGGRSDGGGLPGLATRLASAGGELSWGRQGEVFTVTATVPLAGPPDGGDR